MFVPITFLSPPPPICSLVIFAQAISSQREWPQLTGAGSREKTASPSQHSLSCGQVPDAGDDSAAVPTPAGSPEPPPPSRPGNARING